jgi:hypothetical protein
MLGTLRLLTSWVIPLKRDTSDNDNDQVQLVRPKGRGSPKLFKSSDEQKK